MERTKTQPVLDELLCERIAQVTRETGMPAKVKRRIVARLRREVAIASVSQKRDR